MNIMIIGIIIFCMILIIISMIMIMLKAGTPLWEVEVAVTSLCIALQVGYHDADDHDDS